MASLILTVVGPDRPGLVRVLSEAVAAHGGSWLESRMARLAGQFAGIVLVDAPESLLGDLRALEGQGLRIVVQSGEPAAAASAAPAEPRLALEVVGNDRPGIVRDVTRVLAESGINIEELTTGVASASFSGDTLFRGGPGATGRSFSDFGTIVDSIRDRLLVLPSDTRVLTGHGDETTIGDEAPGLADWEAAR